MEHTSHRLSRRERQILDVLYRLERATAAQIQEHIADAPGYSAVRALLRILEEKGHITHEADGQRYVYLPKVPRDSAKRGAIQHLLRTFFGGSPEQAVAALLDENAARMSDAELDRLQKMIEKARKQGRNK